MAPSTPPHPPRTKKWPPMGPAILGNALVGRVSTELPEISCKGRQSYPESYPVSMTATARRLCAPRASHPGTVQVSPAASALPSANPTDAGISATSPSWSTAGPELGARCRLAESPPRPRSQLQRPRARARHRRYALARPAAITGRFSAPSTATWSRRPGASFRLSMTVALRARAPARR